MSDRKVTEICSLPEAHFCDFSVTFGVPVDTHAPNSNEFGRIFGLMTQHRDLAALAGLACLAGWLSGLAGLLAGLACLGWLL